MPTRERRERTKKDKELADFVASAQNHIRERLGRPSKLGEDSVAGLLRFDFRGLKYAEDGQEAYSHEWGKAGGAFLKNKANKRYAYLKRKYADKWGKRLRISEIAKAENISERTVEPYFARKPQ